MTSEPPAQDVIELVHPWLEAAGIAPEDLTEQQRQMIARLPAWVTRLIAWMLLHWPGRVILRTTADLTRVQIFDRAMTIAAQLFTSVFPIIIMTSAFLGRDAGDTLSGQVDLPQSTEAVLSQAVTTSSSATFGIAGVLVVLISATSLSRALTRAFDTIWHFEKSRSRLFDAWRWLAAVLALALATVATRTLVSFTEPIPPRSFWSLVLTFAVNLAVACYVPWLLMAGRVRIYSLVPGAFLYALVMLLAHPAATRYLPHALETSAARYGAMGVAFTYLTYLYCVSFALLGTAIIGQVIAQDEGAFGRFIRNFRSRPVVVEEVPAAS
jgi:membrane protein